MPRREQTAPNLEDEALIRRYMLGEVSEDERTSIEKRLMSDPEYLGRLQLVETDLADDYASGSLGAREREHFERHFLSAPQHRTKARYAAALRSYITTRRETMPIAGPRRESFGWSFRSAAVLSLTVVALVLAAVLVVQIIQAGRMKRDLQRFEALSQDQASRLQDLTQQVEDEGRRRAQLEQQVFELTRPEESQVVLSDGGTRVTLDGGKLRGLEAIPSRTQEEIGLALASGRVKMPESIAELASAPNVLMGSSEGVPFALLTPIATAVVEQRPRFHWKELKGAVSYTVSIFDQDFRRIAQSEPLTKTEWVIPKPLDRGTIFSWQVTALKDGKPVVSPVRPAPEARFRVLDQAGAEEVELYRRSRTTSHLASGVVYARAGLREDADREFRMLVKENPRSMVARRLLRSLNR